MSGGQNPTLNCERSLSALLARSSDLESISSTPRLDTEILLCHVLKKERSYLFTWPEKTLSPQEYQHFDALFSRRLTGEPVAYILGEREFWSLPLKVSPATLIPRPETERLVEVALDLIKVPNASVLDLGTGTGAIALALASERPGWKILAADNQPKAVQLAEENRVHLKYANVEIRQSDWFDQIDGQFDLIVSNPPYINAEDTHLQEGDVRFEPQSALVADDQGLADIQRIVAHAENHLKPGALLLLEHGAEQGAAVRGIMERAGLSGIKTWFDIAGLDRVTGGYG